MREKNSSITKIKTFSEKDSFRALQITTAVIDYLFLTMLALGNIKLVRGLVVHNILICIYTI